MIAFNVEISLIVLIVFLASFSLNDIPNRIAPISDINTVLLMSRCQVFELQAPASQLTVY